MEAILDPKRNLRVLGAYTTKRLPTVGILARVANPESYHNRGIQGEQKLPVPL